MSNFTVSVNVTGRSKKPKIDLSSTPELEQADILSLLLFRKTSDRLGSAQQNTLSNQAGRMGGSLASGLLEKHLGQALGLDAIEVELGDTESSGRKRVGRWVTQDLFISYERRFRDERTQSRSGNTVSLEKSLNRRLKLKTSSSDIGESALDVLWSLEY